jgi:hypothetical protein
VENQADARVAQANLVRMAEALGKRLLALGALVSLERHAAEWRERVGNEATTGRGRAVAHACPRNDTP